MSRRNKGEFEDELDLTDDIEDAEFVEEGVVPENVRRLRVYDNKGDFIIDIPDNARVTFGYFNPASAGQGSGRYGTGYGDDRGEMRRTALRVYGPGGKENQLAVFCGVKGFRDETQVKLVRLREEVTLTSTLHDDGNGTIETSGKQQRQLTAVRESEIPF